MSERAVTQTPPPVDMTDPPEMKALTSLSISLIAPAMPKLTEAKLASATLKSLECDVNDEVSEAETETPGPEDGETTTVLSTMPAMVCPTSVLEANLESDV